MNPPLIVLLIDDEPAQAWLVREYLQSSTRNPVMVVVEESLTDGLARLENGDIQVLLLDLSLPDSLGVDTFRKVRQAFPDLPVVVFTSLEDEDLGSQLVQLGAQDYLVKGQLNGPMMHRTLRYAIERKQAAAEREQLIAELQKALTEVKNLNGLLPICSHCKKIRDDKGYWHQVERYISAHTEATFSHGLCEECLHKHYPEVSQEVVNTLAANKSKPGDAN
jgi:DNA-binding NarL/FixJ family response regulator